MIRAALVGLSEDDWRLYRQPAWMAEVRRSPGLATLPRRHFDVDEPAYRQILDAWPDEGAVSGLGSALAILARFGATEVLGP